MRREEVHDRTKIHLLAFFWCLLLSHESVHLGVERRWFPFLSCSRDWGGLKDVGVVGWRRDRIERKMSEFGLASMQCLRREIRGVPLLELRLSSYPDGLGCLMGLQMGAVDAERDGSAH